MNEDLMKNLSSRKLWFAFVCFAIATGFCWFGKATFDQWEDMSKWVFGLYIAGNGIEHLSNTYKACNGPTSDNSNTPQQPK